MKLITGVDQLYKQPDRQLSLGMLFVPVRQIAGILIFDLTFNDEKRLDFWFLDQEKGSL